MTAPLSSQLGAAQAGRGAQLAIRAALVAEAAKLWPLLDTQRIAATFPGWVAAMIALVRDYHRQSAQAAAAAYRLARSQAIQSPTPMSLIRLAPDPDPQWMRAAFGYSGPGLLDRDTARPGTALSTTLGTASRIALDGGRQTVLDTVRADPVAVGWYRVTDGHPCAFCAMLAGRGVVYKSHETASFKSHNDCGCVDAPAFSHEQRIPALNQTAADIYDQHARGHGNQLAAFRKAWNDHQAQTA